MLEKLFEQSPFAITYHKYILDNKTDSNEYFFVEANKAFYQLFGFSAGASTEASLKRFFSEPVNSSFTWVNLWNEAVKQESKIVKRTYFNNYKLHLQIEAFKTEEGSLITFISKTSEIKGLKDCGEEVVGNYNENKEIHLRQLILATEFSPASIVVTNSEGLIEYVNPKFTQLTGYTLDEVMGKNPRVLKSGETPDEVYQNLWQTISSGKEWRGIFKNKKRDGELYIEEAVITPVFSESGNICHFVAVKEDITHRVKAEVTIQQHQKKLELLLEVSQMFVSTLDLIKLVQIIVEKGAQLIDVESSAMYYVEGENLKLVASNPPLSDNVPAVFREAVLNDYPILKQVVISKKPFVLEDTSKAVLSAKEQEIINHRHLKTIFYLPLVVEERVLGVLLLGTRSQTKKFYPDDVDLCRTLAAQAALVLQNANLFEKMNRVSEELILQNEEYVRVNNELEVNYALIKDINQELKKAKEKAEENERNLRKSEERLKLKLDYLLTPEMEMPDLALSDLVDLDHLQTIQDSFSKATGVASVITNSKGVPITEPSNFCGVCKLVRETEKGRHNCFLSDSYLGLKSSEIKKPHIEECRSCGFLDAAAPIYIGNKLVAIWLVGQSCTGSVDQLRIANYADDIGANKDQMLEEFSKMNKMSRSQFEDIARLLWLFARDLSFMAYNNLLLARKIEEQKDYENQLIQAKEKAEESDRLKTAFLHNMSHEIRTPMNGILGFSELLRINNLSYEKRQSYISLVVDSTNRLLGIVNDIMDISRLEAGDVVLKSESVYLNEMFNQLYDKYNQQLCKKVKLETPFIDARLSRLIFNSDGERLMQVLDKLLSNAVKFTPKGKIRFGCVQSNKSLRFYVEDTGIGIIPDKVDLIFKPFYQVDMESNREFEGNGLGLTIASRIIEKMGSRIIVESKPGAGSRFYFDILPQPNIYNEEFNNGDNVISHDSSFAILIAEDDLINYLFIQDALNENPDGIEFVIHHACTGLEAIEKLRTHNDICLVLMDIKMPVMDGLSATRIIKEEWPHMPVIAQTALALSGEHEKAVEAGCDAYLTKPIRREWLIQTVYHYLKKVKQ